MSQQNQNESPDPQDCQRCMNHLKEVLQDLSPRHMRLFQSMGIKDDGVFWQTDEKESTIQIQLRKPGHNSTSFGGEIQEPKDEPSIQMSIECRNCGTTGPESGARAYVRGPSPLAIVLCSNRLNSHKDFKQVLLHELIHVYDVFIRNWNLQNCEILAKSEIRAAREAECADERFNMMKRFCVKDRATIATCNMFPNTIGQDCVKNVFDDAINDQAPWDEGEETTTSRDLYLHNIKISKR